MRKHLILISLTVASLCIETFVFCCGERRNGEASRLVIKASHAPETNSQAEKLAIAARYAPKAKGTAKCCNGADCK